MKAIRLKAVPLLSLAAVFVAGVSIHPALADDNAFVIEALKADNNEVALGALAQSRGASAKVRDYGRMLVDDHGAHARKLADLERNMGLSPTPALSDDGMKAKAMLEGLHGAEFDAAFKQHMIEDHTKDIAKYEDASKTATSTALRQTALDTLPTLHKHLEHARDL